MNEGGDVERQATAQRALILGASSAVAEALARQLAREGWDLILAGRHRARLEPVAADLALRFGAGTVVWEFDALDLPGHASLAQRVSVACGDFHLVVCVFGYLGDQELVRRDTDEMVWRFGEDGDFTMVGDGEWQYHQHSPNFTGDGRFILYDNGNTRTTLEEGEIPFSRAVEYAIDEEAMTARQVWEYRGEAPYCSPFMGDARQLPGGNILITDGAIVSDPDLHEIDPNNHKSLRIVEVTYEEEPQKVFELVIDDNDETPMSYTAYRTIRIPSLYTNR